MGAGASNHWYSFIRMFEGEVAYMYVDTNVNGYITVGIGNKIDPLSLATSLPFQFKGTNRLGIKGGTAATAAQITTEWNRLKNHPQRSTLASRGAAAFAAETDLELSSTALRNLFNAKTAENERALVAAFPDFAKWPSDAQVATMAMAWGLGTSKFPSTWPSFSAACRNQDFDLASRQCSISTWRAERNTASVRLFENSARVLSNPTVYEPNTFYYPTILLDQVVISA